MNKEALEKSIVLIGPIGVGKSVIANELSINMGLDVISTDLLRFCPHNIEPLQQENIELQKQIDSKKTINLFLLNKSKKIHNTIRNCEQKIHFNNKLIKLRTLLPNVPNYYEMGYRPEIAELISQNYGNIAWHCYNKEYEIKLMQAIVENLNEPLIIDTGGGVPNVLQNDREVALKDNNGKVYFSMGKNKTALIFDDIKKTFSNFGNVVYLKMPQRIESEKAKDSLNESFIQSGQYEKLATQTISTENLIKNDKLNPERLKNIVCEIKGNVLEKEVGISI